MKIFSKLFILLGFLGWLFSGAFVSNGYDLVITFIDQGANTKTQKFRLWALPAAIPVILGAVWEALAAAFVANYAAITKAKIIRYSLNSLYSETTTPFIGAAGSEVEEIGIITARIDTTGWSGSGEIKNATVRVIAPIDGVFVGAPGTGPAYNLIDNTDAALIAYLQNFEYGIGLPFVSISDEEPLADPTDPTNWYGKRGHTGSSKG